jgi:hypothetical protein
LSGSDTTYLTLKLARKELELHEREAILCFYEQILDTYCAFTHDSNRARIHEQLREAYYMTQLFIEKKSKGADPDLPWQENMSNLELLEYINDCIKTLFQIGGSLNPDTYPEFTE